MLARAMPEPGLRFRVVHRQAGMGSLGRRRFTALAEWRGGMVAREAKELTSSAWNWERDERRECISYEDILKCAVRMADPFVALRGRWLVRRLAPDCSRIELASLPRAREEEKLLHAMGWETANVHLGSEVSIKNVTADLRRRPARWLRDAVKTMVEATRADWKEWRRLVGR